MSIKKLYVGNLPFSFEDADLANLFSQAGTVESARVIMDGATGRKKGFGFVEMSTPEEAQAAVDMLNGTDVGGRTIVVDLARERPPRDGGSGGGYRGGGRDGGRDGGRRRRPYEGGGGGYRGNGGGR